MARSRFLARASEILAAAGSAAAVAELTAGESEDSGAFEFGASDLVERVAMRRGGMCLDEQI
jgi:hypothetical protein